MLGLINPLFSNSWIVSFILDRSTSSNIQWALDIRSVSSASSILDSISLSRGSPRRSSKKTIGNSLVMGTDSILYASGSMA